ncbi:MAG TPA: hypothetical protein VJ938_05765 [Acidimicrobiia bacterium]|nr:hypothetical protein [Acidimicrobiia bacterium]
MRLAGREVPVILPTLRDPRLHLAAVIISIHVLGQVALGFRVSVPQILAAILTCALVEVIVTYLQSGRLVWPASAMLTGSGVALILRVVGTERGDHWSWSGWHIFALVAGLSLATKYWIRYRDGHVFNPSNVGLVASFLVLGSRRVEPLDFWWAPLDGWMVIAYFIILVGGMIITRRLRLLAMATVFWVTLATGLALVAASGHCMTAAWALGPVCDWHFWWIVMSSPEVLIFLFFMITDPKTIPGDGRARLLFAAAIGVVSTLLIAPQSTEFGAKVGLLAGLVLLSPVRNVFDRLLGAGPVWHRLTAVPSAAPTRVFARGALMGASIVVLAAVIVLAGGPARRSAQAAVEAPAPTVNVSVDTDSIPVVTVDDGVAALNSDVAADDGRALALALAENLAIESEARRRSDPSLLRAVDHGERLVVMERRIEGDAVAKRRIVEAYSFESLHLRAIYGASTQLGPSLGFDAEGTLVQVTYDEDLNEVARESTPFATTFILNQATGDRWLIVSETSRP